MRIAVLTISLAAFFTICFEWLAVGINGLGASISTGHGFKSGASAGAAVALLYLIGAAFSMGRPLVSFAVFTLGALVGIVAGMPPRWRCCLCSGTESGKRDRIAFMFRAAKPSRRSGCRRIFSTKNRL